MENRSSRSSFDIWWENLKPGLRAAVYIVVVVIALELFSNTIPAIGFLVTIPVAMIVYYLQGILAGSLVSNDSRYTGAGAGTYAFQGLISGFWTGVVLSAIVDIIFFIIATPITLGTILIGFPLILASSGVDIVLNLGFSVLGAWFYYLYHDKGLIGVSCLVLTLVMACLFLIAAIMVVLLFTAGISLIHHLGITPAIIHFI
jgi:hypothetical protein